jgi:ribonuclease HII
MKNSKGLLPHYYTGMVEAGCDEAGRGCLAGSVYAAAVILPPDYDNPELNDSKKLSEKKRYALREQIQHDAVAWAVGIVTPEEIDEVNILHASFLAMHRALAQLSVQPEALIIDGNRFDAKPRLPHNGFWPTLNSNNSNNLTPNSYLLTPNSYLLTPNSYLLTPNSYLLTPNSITCVVHGDAKYQAIAAASILAKTYRDDYMNQLDEEFPMYDWRKNKGYPTKEHRAAIAKYGITKYHRKSFNLYGDRQLELQFE